MGPGWGSVGPGTLIIAGHGFFENTPYEKKKRKKKKSLFVRKPEKWALEK